MAEPTRWYLRRIGSLGDVYLTAERVSDSRGYTTLLWVESMSRAEKARWRRVAIQRLPQLRAHAAAISTDSPLVRTFDPVEDDGARG